MPPVKAGGIFMSSNGNKWQQFAKLKRDVQLNDVATTPIDTIVISDAEPV